MAGGGDYQAIDGISLTIWFCGSDNAGRRHIGGAPVFVPLADNLPRWGPSHAMHRGSESNVNRSNYDITSNTAGRCGKTGTPVSAADAGRGGRVDRVGVARYKLAAVLHAWHKQGLQQCRSRFHASKKSDTSAGPPTLVTTNLPIYTQQHPKRR